GRRERPGTHQGAFRRQGFRLSSASAARLAGMVRPRSARRRHRHGTAATTTGCEPSQLSAYHDDSALGDRPCQHGRRVARGVRTDLLRLARLSHGSGWRRWFGGSAERLISIHGATVNLIYPSQFQLTIQSNRFTIYVRLAIFTWWSPEGDAMAE